MAGFDPDAFLASSAPARPAAAPAAAGGFDPDAFLAAVPNTTPAQQRAAALFAPVRPDALGKTFETQDKGALNAFALGATQGGSAGFFDEAASGLKALAEAKDLRELGKRYRDERGRERESIHEAEDKHGIAFGAGGLAGAAASAAIPGAGLGGLARAAGGGAKGAAAIGAAYGAATGAGTSEEDSIGGTLLDAGKGALLGGATAGLLAKGGELVGKGISKLAGGAEERIIQRDLGALTKGAPKGMRDKLVGVAGDRTKDVAAFVRETGLDKLSKDPKDALAVVKAARQEAGKFFGQIDDAVEQAVGGIAPDTITQALDKVAADFRKQGNVAGLRAVDRIAKSAPEVLDKPGLIPVSQFRGFASNAADVAFEAGGTAPKLAKRVERQVTGALGQVLREHIAQAAELSPEVAKLAPELPRMTTVFGIAKDLERPLAYRVQSSQYPTTGLRDIAMKASNLPALVFGGPKALAAKLALEHGLPAVANRGDRILMALAKTGAPTAAIMQTATKLGIPTAVAERIAAMGSSLQPANAVP